MNDLNFDYETLMKAIDTYGRDLQLNQVIQECAELIQACSKTIQKGTTNDKNMLEEVADVYIMLEQLKIMFKFLTEEAIQKVIDEKIKRLKERLEKVPKQQ